MVLILGQYFNGHEILLYEITTINNVHEGINILNVFVLIEIFGLVATKYANITSIPLM
jgi:hypothetical protein